MRIAPLLGLAALGVLVSCAPAPKPPIVTPPVVDETKPAQVQLRQWTYQALVGWNDDRQGEALVALNKSCDLVAKRPVDRLMAANPAAPGGRVGDWKLACSVATTLDPTDHTAARHFFKTYFIP